MAARRAMSTATFLFFGGSQALAWTMSHAESECGGLLWAEEEVGFWRCKGEIPGSGYASSGLARAKPSARKLDVCSPWSRPRSSSSKLTHIRPPPLTMPDIAQLVPPAMLAGSLGNPIWAYPGNDQRFLSNMHPSPGCRRYRPMTACSLLVLPRHRQLRWPQHRY
jgi:hypothetical protein